MLNHAVLLFFLCLALVAAGVFGAAVADEVAPALPTWERIADDPPTDVLRLGSIVCVRVVADTGFVRNAPALSCVR